MPEKCAAINKSGKNCRFYKTIGDYCNRHEHYIYHKKYGTNGITITFGDQAENNKGMQIIGSSAGAGYNINDFNKIIKNCANKGIVTELYNLNEICNTENNNIIKNAPTAHVLVIKNGVTHLLRDSGLESDHDDLFDEHIKLEWDSKAYMRSEVKNKKARHNLCYGEFNQEPDYEAKKGRIVAFDDIKLTKCIKEKLSEFFGEKSCRRR